MRSTINICVALLSITAVLAAPPAAKTRKGRSYSIDRIENPNHVRVGAVAMRKAFGKYGWDMPQIAQKDAAALSQGKGSDGSSGIRVAASSTPSAAETQFLVPVTIAGQTLAMNIDTGSSDLWVFSSKLPSSSSKGHAVFDPAQSSTFQSMKGASFTIKYGDQSHASGLVGLDTVNIGGAEVQNQAVELATTVSGSFVQDHNADGLVGLGFGVSNQVKPAPQKTFFENVMSTLEEPVFTAALKRGEPGSYEFGTIDKAKFSGSLNYVPVDSSKGWWQFDSPGVIVANQTISTPGVSSIADTGTSILLMQDEVVKAYYAQVPGAQSDKTHGGFVYPCDAPLPDLGIAITDSYTATVPGSLLTFSQADQSTCFGALQSNEGQPVQILGDTFFNSQFVVFDGGKTQLGFAPHA